jgi:hypothetical protein
MDKIKESLSAIWGWIVVVVGAAIGIMLYIIQAKQKKIDALNAKVELADTQKKADLIEVEIKQHLDNADLLDKEAKELNKSLDNLEQKRKEIAASEKNKTSDEVESFWNKKQ